MPLTCSGIIMALHIYSTLSCTWERLSDPPKQVTCRIKLSSGLRRVAMGPVYFTSAILSDSGLQNEFSNDYAMTDEICGNQANF